MKVKDLIEKLKEFSPDDEITVVDKNNPGYELLIDEIMRDPALHEVILLVE